MNTHAGIFMNTLLLLCALGCQTPRVKTTEVSPWAAIAPGSDSRGHWFTKRVKFSGKRRDFTGFALLFCKEPEASSQPAECRLADIRGEDANMYWPYLKEDIEAFLDEGRLEDQERKNTGGRRTRAR